MAIELDEETAAFIDSMRLGGSNAESGSWKEFFRNANNRLCASQSSPQEAYRSLPRIIRKIQKTQSSIDRFISDYYGTIAVVFDKVKGKVANFLGIHYSQKGMQDIVAEQAANVRDAEYTLEMLVEHTDSVIGELSSYHGEIIGSRARAVDKLTDLREVISKNERMKSQLVIKINELEMGNPDYHLIYRAVTKLEHELAGYEVESLQASLDLGAYSNNIEAIEAILKVAGQGLKDATLARSGFHHAAELLERLSPYFGLANGCAQDHSWILKEAKDAHDSVGDAISLSIDAFGSLGRLSSAASVYSGVPLGIAKSMQAYSPDVGGIKAAYAEAGRLMEHKGL